MLGCEVAPGEQSDCSLAPAYRAEPTILTASTAQCASRLNLECTRMALVFQTSNICELGCRSWSDSVPLVLTCPRGAQRQQASGAGYCAGAREHGPATSFLQQFLQGAYAQDIGPGLVLTGSRHQADGRSEHRLQAMGRVATGPEQKLAHQIRTHDETTKQGHPTAHIKSEWQYYRRGRR